MINSKFKKNTQRSQRLNTIYSTTTCSLFFVSLRLCVLKNVTPIYNQQRPRTL
jgi:hypothetical protein